MGLAQSCKQCLNRVSATRHRGLWARRLHGSNSSPPSARHERPRVRDGNIYAPCMHQVRTVDELGVDAARGFAVQSDGLPKIPNIEKLCQQGIRFTKAWSAPSCSPTRRAILTGRHAFRTGVLVPSSLRAFLNPSEWTIPQLETELNPGLALADIGKWHLGSTTAQQGPRAPNTLGWTHYAGLLEGVLPTTSVGPKSSTEKVYLSMSMRRPKRPTTPLTLLKRESPMSRGSYGWRLTRPILRFTRLWPNCTG